MCPVCIATLALIGVGATSAGLTALVAKKLHMKAGAVENRSDKLESRENEGECHESSPSCIAI